MTTAIRMTAATSVTIRDATMVDHIIRGATTGTVMSAGSPRQSGQQVTHGNEGVHRPGRLVVLQPDQLTHQAGGRGRAPPA